jgi:hypothetical protein
MTTYDPSNLTTWEREQVESGKARPALHRTGIELFNPDMVVPPNSPDYLIGETPICGRCQWAKPVCRCVVPDRFTVIENTPGYMPDADELAEFDEYSDAVAYANELADELEKQGYVTDRSWASSDNSYAIHAERTDMVAPDLGRNIEVVKIEEDS